MNDPFDDEDVTAVYRSPLGAQVFNAYTRARRNELLFSQRLRVVRAMLRAMLDAEDAIHSRSVPVSRETSQKP